MPIVIKKKVSFDFLGKDYQDAYLVFQSIPIKDYDELTTEIQQAEKDGKSGSFLLVILKKYFINGVFPELPDVKQDDLDGLDQEAVITCFSRFTGQEIDPKAEKPSKKPSSTMPDGPQN